MIELMDYDDYKSVIRDKALIFFSAEWCEPCKKFMEKILKSKKISKIRIKWYKINTDNEKMDQVIVKHKVNFIPIIFLMVNGKRKVTFTNIDDIDYIVKKINHTIERSVA